MVYGEQKEETGGETKRRNTVGTGLDRSAAGVSSSKALSAQRCGGGGWQRKCSPLLLLFCVSGLRYSSYQFSTVLYPTLIQMYVD